MAKVFKGRVCLSGKFEGSAEVSHIGVNPCATWGDVFLGGGDSSLCSDHDNPDLYGHDLKDKVLCLPQTIGSSSAGTVWLQILDKGIAPKALLFSNHIDTMAACGLLMADIWRNQRIFCVDNLGDEFLATVKCGDKIQVSDDGTVTITPKGGAQVKRYKKASIVGDDQARNDLNGFVGADANYTLTSQSGTKPKGDDVKMKLTPEEQAMFDGSKGDVYSKGIRTIVRYGELFGAKELTDLQGAPHMAMSWGSDSVKPFLDIYAILADAGMKSYAPFTANPKPMDYKNLPMTDAETNTFKTMYHLMDELEEMNLRLGMKKDAWSCACYLPEVGNRPKFGDNLAWSESSAINFVNSALGARTNRNAMGIDMLCSVLCKAPKFGLLTDEGRQADWLIDIRIDPDQLDHLPHPEMVGGAVGMKCVETTPYIIGMDKFLTKGVCEESEGYLKDFGAATASNGALGLYHMEGVTPEAVKYGRKLLNPGYKTYVIDLPELERIYNSYPNMWKEKDAMPQRVFIGCPHLSYGQFIEWGERIVKAMEEAKKDKVGVETCLFGSQVVQDDFKRRNPELYQKLVGYGVIFTLNCPVMWCTAPVANAERIATQSNKTRVYSTARFFFDAALTHLVVYGTLPKQLISLVTAPAGKASSGGSGDIEDVGK